MRRIKADKIFSGSPRFALEAKNNQSTRRGGVIPAENRQELDRAGQAREGIAREGIAREGIARDGIARDGIARAEKRHNLGRSEISLDGKTLQSSERAAARSAEKQNLERAAFAPGGNNLQSSARAAARAGARQNLERAAFAPGGNNLQSSATAARVGAKQNTGRVAFSGTGKNSRPARTYGKFSVNSKTQLKNSSPQSWLEILKSKSRLAEKVSDRDLKQALTFFVTAGIIVYLLAGTFTLALPFALAAAYLPFYFTLRNQAKRHRELVEVWPELIDHLLTGLRSGMSIIQALVALEKTGPEITREIIGMAALDLRKGGSTSAFFSQLKAAFADPISDQALEVMQYSREVGGRDTATTLKSLGDYARAQISLRQEIVAKRAWIGNSAKIAAAAPWILLLILSLQPTTMLAFRKPAGFLILACGALATLIGYAWMSKVGQIPQPVRILRS